MKRLKLYSILPLFILTACSDDFLRVVPESSITTGNFYKTETQFLQALTGVYASLRGGISSEASWIMGEMRADNTRFDFNPNDRGEPYLMREDIDKFMDNSSNQWVADKYNNCYAGISRANAIIDRLPESSVGETAKQRIMAEARFLRALFYLDLVRYYGDVPLYLHEVKGVGDANLPRSPSGEVFDAITEDAQYAMENLPAPTTTQDGRATKGSAAMLLAYVYMTNKNFAQAETTLKTITQMGYGLLPDYASVFSTTNKNSKESIFEVQYQQGNQGQNSSFVYNFMPIANTVLLTGIDGVNRIGGWNIPTMEMIASYEANDKRLEASIGIAEGSGSTGFFTIEAVKSPVGYTQPAAGKIFKPYIKKYLHPHSLLYNTDDNFPVYRYADALLLLAEALNENGKSADALTYLNQVRVRAGLNPTTEKDQTALRKIIAHERRVELAFENKRWMDLVRTGQAIDIMTENGKYLKSFDPLLPANSYQVTQNRLIYAIPNREVIIGNLSQNPGY